MGVTRGKIGVWPEHLQTELMENMVVPIVYLDERFGCDNYSPFKPVGSTPIFYVSRASIPKKIVKAIMLLIWRSPKNRKSPIAGWFMSWKVPLELMIWGVPIFGKHCWLSNHPPSVSWWDPQRMMVSWTSPSILKPTYRILKGCKRHISRQSPPARMTNHDLTVESRILHSHFPHRPQRSHHCAEAPYERPRQRPGCRIVRPGKSPGFFRESKRTVDVQDGKPLIDIDWGIFPGILGVYTYFLGFGMYHISQQVWPTHQLPGIFFWAE